MKDEKSPLSVLRTSCASRLSASLRVPRWGQEKMVNGECRMVKIASTALPEVVLGGFAPAGGKYKRGFLFLKSLDIYVYID